jgi:hypothetical protein
MSTWGTLGWPGRVAVAVVHGDPPEVFLAENDATLGRLLALQLVAPTPSAQLAPDVLREIRAALLEERWADALTTWMEATGAVVDAYPDEEVVQDEALNLDRASIEIRMAPIFVDPDG